MIDTHLPDSGFRLPVRRTQTGRNDGKENFSTFYEPINK